MNIFRTQLEDVWVLTPRAFSDARGFFMESYSKRSLLETGMEYDFVQDNQSLSVPAGTIRGLHYQLGPRAQTKLVQVVKGAIYDVAVDLRKESPTFGHWIGVILSDSNRKQLLIPKGFAHGFCTLVADTQVFYKVDEYYSPEHDRGILWSDPQLAITWPTDSPTLSEKDAHHPLLRDADINF